MSDKTPVVLSTLTARSGDTLDVKINSDTGEVSLYAHDTWGADAPRDTHMVANRDSLLEALGAVDQSTLQALLETRTAERDAALESDRKHGEVVQRLAHTQAALEAAQIEQGRLGADLYAERRAHALLADAHREVTSRSHSPEDQQAMRDLLEQVSTVVGYSGDLDCIPEAVSHRVRVVAQQREQFQRERDALRLSQRRIAYIVGFPGGAQGSDFLDGLEEFVQAQVTNLGRRASTAEDERDAMHNRLEAVESMSAANVRASRSEQNRLRDQVRNMDAVLREQTGRLVALEAAPLDDVAARMTVEVDGRVRDVTVEPAAWRAVLAFDGTHDGPVVLARADGMLDGRWSLQCTAYAAEPVRHQGRSYATPAGLPWTEVRERLGNLVAVALDHREGDARTRQEAMDAMQRIVEAPTA